MLLCVDDYLAVLHGTHHLVLIGTLDTHVSDEVRDLTHLCLSALLSHLLHAITVWILTLSIKALHTPEGFACLDTTCVVRDSNDCVTIEVCTRQLLCYISIDTNSIGR